MAQAKYEIRRRCPICGEVFQIRTIDAVYCSKQCSDIAYKRKKDREAKEAKYEQIAKEIPDIREFLSVQEAEPFIALNVTLCIARFVRECFLLSTSAKNN